MAALAVTAFALQSVWLASLVGGEADTGWSYGDHTADWPGVCATGERQSPVHMETRYARAVVRGHAFAASYPPDAVATVASRSPELVLDVSRARPDDGSAYVLTRVRFRWPAEHQLDDELADLEVQLYHRRADFEDDARAYAVPGGVLAVAALYVADTDYDNPLLAPVLEAAREQGPTVVETSLEGLASPQRSAAPVQWFRYDGSETTPGCRETVDWCVYRDYGFLSYRQLRQFAAITGVPEARRPPVRTHFRNFTVYVSDWS